MLKTRERLLVEDDELIMAQIDLLHRLQSVKRASIDLLYYVVAEVECPQSARCVERSTGDTANHVVS